ICQQYQQIMNTVMSVPGTTEELVELCHFLKRTGDVTVHTLRDDISEAARRLEFLLDHAPLT
ncbi:dynein heavy chain 3, axonemal, partial [Clarias magur]